MNVASIGVNIVKLRRKKGATQETLAKFVGVSPQAVSKWENGGVPDTELLPRIADFFSVSIDTLFGRNITDYSYIETALGKKVAETPPEERFDTAFELCWVLERALFGDITNDDRIRDYRAKLGRKEQRYSSIRSDEGYTLMGIANRLPYFLLVPETEEKDAALFDGIDYLSLFRDLSDRVVFDALVFLHQRSADKAFTPALLMKSLGIDFDKAIEVIQTLRQYGVIHVTVIEMDDAAQEIYKFEPTPSFPAMLIFAREIIDKPGKFTYFCAGRKKPYLA